MDKNVMIRNHRPLWHNIVIVSVLFLCLLLTACSPADESGAAVQEEAITEIELDGETEEASEEAVEWKPEGTVFQGENAYAAYLEVLKAYEPGIKGYYWQKDSSGENLNTYQESSNTTDNNPYGNLLIPEKSESRAVVITDILGDSTPELLFMCANSYYEAELRIFGYDAEAKEATEFEYTDKVYSGQSVKFTDGRFDGGEYIMIYTGSAKDTLYMVSLVKSGTFTASVSRYTCSEDEIAKDWTVENRYDPSEEDGFDAYFLDEQEISEDQGIARFSQANSEYGRLLLYSGATDTISVFSRVMTDEPAAMTYDGAVEWLSGQE